MPIDRGDRGRSGAPLNELPPGSPRASGRDLYEDPRGSEGARIGSGSLAAGRRLGFVGREKESILEADSGFRSRVWFQERRGSSAEQ